MPKITLNIVCITFLLCACGSDPKNKIGEKNTKNNFPKNGEYYFKSNELNFDSPEFIYLQILNGNVKGELMVTEYDERRFHSITGNFTSDTTMEVSVTHKNTEVLENWAVKINGDTMRAEGIFGMPGTFFYHKISYLKMPAKNIYTDVTLIEEDTTTYPQTEPVWYGSVSPNASKRTPYYEFIQLWKDSGTVKGRGAGKGDGDPAWYFDFEGTVINDTVLKVRANYRQDGNPQLSTNETWIVFTAEKRMRLKKKIPGGLRGSGSGEYYLGSKEEVGEYFLNIIKKTKPR